MNATFTMGALFVAIFTHPDGSMDYTGPWRGADTCRDVVEWNVEYDDTLTGVCVQEFSDTAPLISPRPQRRPE